jgi:hypothetical protein
MHRKGEDEPVEELAQAAIVIPRDEDDFSYRPDLSV